jgi:hypothetical protein
VTVPECASPNLAAARPQTPGRGRSRAVTSRHSRCAPLIRADCSRLDTGRPQRSQHGACADTQVRGHERKRTSREVQLGGFVEIDSIDNAIPHLDARSTQVRGEGAPVDTELGRQRVRRLPRFVPPDNLGSLRIGQSRLFLAERWDGSMGHPIAPLTSEDSLQTRHDVGVGVTTHELHNSWTETLLARALELAELGR